MNKPLKCLFAALFIGGISGFAFAEPVPNEKAEPALSSQVSEEGSISAPVMPSVAGANSPEKLVPSGSKKPAPAIPKETLFWLYGILFLGVGFLAYKFWKKGSLVRSNSKQSKLQVLEMRMLGNKQFLLVVEYDGQRMLLGVSPGIIQHICVLGEEAQSGSIPPGTDFSELLGSGHTMIPKKSPRRDPAHS